ncbi:MAG: hypothetical protein FD167_2481 [bacterium]|nr:MAG: hypothetical protein FD167_2481 [bacterium]
MLTDQINIINQINGINSISAVNHINHTEHTEHTNTANNRRYKRVLLKTTLFVRRPFNHISCRKEVETLNVSAQGLLISSSFPLEIGEEIEITNQGCKVRAIVTVKHIHLDINTGRYLIGLAIISSPSCWLVIEGKSHQPYQQQ